MMKPYRILTMAICVLVALSLTSTAEVPKTMNYQGYLTDSTGTPLDTTLNFEFLIYSDTTGATTLWSEVQNGITVTDGILNVLLGASNPIPHTVFDGSMRGLGIKPAGGSVSDPLIPLVTVAYAFRAMKADTAGYALAGAGGGGYWQPGLGGAGSIYYDGGNVGIGNSRPAHTLDVTGDINTSTLYRSNGATILKDLGSQSIALGIHAGETGESETSTFLGHNAGQFGVGLDNTYVGYAAGLNASGESNVYVGSGTGSNATNGEDNTAVGRGAGTHATGYSNAFLGSAAGGNETGNRNTYLGYASGLGSTNGSANTLVGAYAGRNLAGSENTMIGMAAGNNATGSGCVFLGDSAGYNEDTNNKLVIDNSGSGIPLLYGDFSNNRLGINTTALNYTLNVLGGVNSFGSGSGYRFDCPGGMLPSTFRLYGSNGYARLWNSFGGEVLRISSGGYTNIGGSSAEPHRLYVESSNWRVPGATAFFRNNSDSGIALLADNTSDDATAVFVNYGSGDVLRCFSSDGGVWDLAFFVTSWGRAICNELELLGGSDLAEPFAMSGGEVPAGALVVIDDENPGKLKLSHRSYDTRVAGIVSGAGGVKPGLTLTQKDVFEDGQNVAINGRVYCLADASYGVIKPGDLLTTSDTPGHAMKAADRDRAYGSVIGKAMSRLNDDTGLVLVLVNLQ